MTILKKISNDPRSFTHISLQSTVFSMGKLSCQIQLHVLSLQFRHKSKILVMTNDPCSFRDNDLRR